MTARLARAGAGPTLRLAARALAARRLVTRVDGAANLPRRGPVLLAARHFHHLWDGVVLLAAVPRPLHVLVALDWCDTARRRRVMEWATRTARWPALLRAERLVAGAPPSAFAAGEVDRYCRHAIRDAIALLLDGRAVAVFPEAYPTIDPRGSPKRDHAEILPFRRGVCTIATTAARRTQRTVPVVPVGLRYDAGPRWTVTARFGDPLPVDARTDAVDLLRELERRVRRLSG